jgi:hypothetical protein
MTNTQNIHIYIRSLNSDRYWILPSELRFNSISLLRSFHLMESASIRSVRRASRHLSRNIAWWEREGRRATASRDRVAKRVAEHEAKSQYCIFWAKSQHWQLYRSAIRTPNEKRLMRYGNRVPGRRPTDMHSEVLSHYGTCSPVSGPYGILRDRFTCLHYYTRIERFFTFYQSKSWR